jgi:Farnesoic acid 0-methyl transferase
MFSDAVGVGGNTYEAALGIIDNTKSVLREGPQGVNVVIEDTPGIMSCDEYR